jgi:uncharacterized protein (UPF0212 family)
VDIKKYGEKVLRRIEALSDQEFIDLLIESGLDKCPFIDEVIIEKVVIIENTYISDVEFEVHVFNEVA